MEAGGGTERGRMKPVRCGDCRFANCSEGGEEMSLPKLFRMEAEG